MSILGNRIKKERENLNLSREDLAKKIGVSYSAIAMYEQGHREPNNELLLKMSEIFDCSMDYLMGKNDFKTNKEALDSYVKTQNNLILADFIEKHKEQFNRLGFNKEDIYGFLDTLNPSQTTFSMKSYAKYVKKYLNRFDTHKQKDVYNLFLDALQELNEKKEDFDIYHKLMILKEKEEKGENQSKSTVETVDAEPKQFYMTPVYRSNLSWTT